MSNLLAGHAVVDQHNRQRHHDQAGGAGDAGPETCGDANLSGLLLQANESWRIARVSLLEPLNRVRHNVVEDVYSDPQR